MRVYKGKVPTDIEVDKLRRSIGRPEHGELITHERICEITGLDYPSNRYVSVISAWRKSLLREFNVQIKARRGEGWVVLKPSERVRESAVQMIGGIRRIRKAAVDAQDINPDDLGEHDKKRRNHLMLLGQELVLAGDTGRRVFESIGGVTNIEKVKGLRPG